MPICAEVNRAMQELTGVHKATSEQNQEVTKSQMARDWKDTFVIVNHLMDRNQGQIPILQGLRLKKGAGSILAPLRPLLPPSTRH